MKKTVLFFLVVLTNLSRAQVPTAGLIGRWEFNGNANDASPSGNHGIVYGASLISDRCNNPQSAYHFNGTSDYIQMTQAGPTGNRARSISCWCRTTNATINTPLSIFDYGLNNGSGGAWQVVFNYCTQGVGIDVSNHAFTAQNTCISDGGWHHIVITYQDCFCSFTTAIVYIDGVVTSLNCTNGGSTQQVNTLANCPVTIGTDACAVQRFFQGDLDDFYLYNRVLTQQEVLNLYNSQCSIIGNANPCPNSSNGYSTPPVFGASYNWTLPTGWTFIGSNNTSNITASTTANSGIITCVITTSCSVITRTMSANVLSMGLSAPNVTFCTNQQASAQITAYVTVTDPITFNWSNNVTGQSQFVTPLVNTPYTVTATNLTTGCTETVSMQVAVISTCCAQATNVNGFAFTSVTCPGSISGPIIIANNLTINGPGIYTMQNGDFIMGPGVSITLASSATLVLSQAHFFTCGNNLWKGFIVQDGSNIVSAPPSGGLPTLIEDAEIAIHLSGITTSHAIPLLDLDGVIFNKNYIGIRLDNSTTYGSSTLQLKVRSCVFTCRDLLPSTMSWPKNTTSSGDLRYATPTALGGLAAPFLTTYNVVGQIKSGTMPFINNNISWAGIQIYDIGNGTAPGVDLMSWAVPSSNEFNLFDFHFLGIDIRNSSLTTYNNTFQNINHFDGSPVNDINYQSDFHSPSGAMKCSGVCINHIIDNNMNAGLYLTPPATAQPGTHSRFWDFLVGINARNLYELDVQKSTFRCDGHVFGQAATQNVLNDHFEMGIRLESNRFNYTINQNQFHNLTMGIKFLIAQGSYNVNYNSMNYSSASGVFGGPLSINQNYFGAGISSFQTLGSQNYFLCGIYIFGSNNFNWTCPALISTINSNRMDRCHNGIYMKELNIYRIEVDFNEMKLIDDPLMPPGFFQSGIYLENIAGSKLVTRNVLYSTGVGSNKIQLVRAVGPNSGVAYRCNKLSNAYTGFDFTGNHTGVWVGNSMTNLNIGLYLEPGAVIGVQGSTLMASGNKWIGSIGTFPLHTKVDFPANALNSALYLDSNFPFPSPNGGSSGSNYNIAGALTPAPPFNNVCSTGNPLPVPQLRESIVAGVEENFKSADENYAIYPNPAQNKLTIVGAEENVPLHVEIVDLSGKIVFSNTLTTVNYETIIELSIQPGMYIVTILDQNRSRINKKLIIE